ncbi:MAG: hypothetical protein DHS20C14_04900 [Phycisphaeraceae bacterium]|nr:MAG: hypothetical protein DHS20C14_04900 [Phycisphaeraceae bacterium]
MSFATRNSPDHLPPGPFEWTPEVWDSAKKEVRAALIERAKLRGMITYSELADQLTAIKVAPHDVRYFSLLGEVSIDEHNEGRPLLSVLVVHKSGDGEPGKGFFQLAKSLGKNTNEVTAFWVEEFKKVHAYWAS